MPTKFLAALTMCVMLMTWLQPCQTITLCLPSKCEFNQIESYYLAGQPLSVINTSTSYDALGQRIYTRSGVYIILDLYTKDLYTSYSYELGSGTCWVTQALNYTMGFPAKCLSGFQLVRTFNVGGVSVDDYQSSPGDLLQVFNNSIPMNLVYLGSQALIEFQDLTFGIKNPDIFNVPPACKKAKVVQHQGKLPVQRTGIKHRPIFP